MIPAASDNDRDDTTRLLNTSRGTTELVQARSQRTLPLLRPLRWLSKLWNGNRKDR